MIIERIENPAVEVVDDLADSIRGSGGKPTDITVDQNKSQLLI